MKHTLVFSLGIALLGAGMGTAQAQRAPIDRSDRRAQRQQAMQNMTPEQRSQFFQNQRQQRYNAASPEQRARMDAARANRQNNGNGTNQNGTNAQGTRGTGGRNGRNSTGGATATPTLAQRESQMRAFMNTAGITDKKQQDPIVAFVFAQDKPREQLLKSAREVATLLGNSQSTPGQISTKWTAYQTALETDKTRYEKELDALDTKIGWSKDKRLESFLSLVCVLDADASVIGGAPTIFGGKSPVRPVSTTNTPPQNGTTVARKN